MKRYEYIHWNISFIYHGSNITGVEQIGSHNRKINMINLFKTVKNIVDELDYSSNMTELVLIAYTNEGIYKTSINGKKLRKVYNRLISKKGK